LHPARLSALSAAPVTTLRNEASCLERWAATLPPTDEGLKLEAAALFAWNYLRCAAALIPATDEHEFEYHRQLRKQFEMTDDDRSFELECLCRELDGNVEGFR
jgi:hypothetical protein